MTIMNVHQHIKQKVISSKWCNMCFMERDIDEFNLDVFNNISEKCKSCTHENFEPDDYYLKNIVIKSLIMQLKGRRNIYDSLFEENKKLKKKQEKIIKENQTMKKEIE